MLAETDDGNEKIQTSNICSVKTGYLELSFITLFIHSHTYFSLISYKYTDILWFLKLENNFLLQSIPEVMLKKGEGSFINQLECVTAQRLEKENEPQNKSILPFLISALWLLGSFCKLDTDGRWWSRKSRC